MDFAHAEALKAESAIPIEVARIKSAGHNLLVDNPLGFTQAVMASAAAAAATGRPPPSTDDATGVATGGFDAPYHAFDRRVFGAGVVEADRAVCAQQAAAAQPDGKGRV